LTVRWAHNQTVPSIVPKRLKYFSYGTLIMVRVLALLLGCLGAYLLIYEKVPKTTGFGTN